MKYPLLLFVLTGLLLAANPSAEQLARAAEKAQNSGQLVRAYMLYAEAAARDPKNSKYAVEREALKPLADMLAKAGVEKAPAKEDLLTSAMDELKQPLQPVGILEKDAISKLLPPPKIELGADLHSFHSRTSERSLYELVARAYGLKVVFDPQLDPLPNVSLDMDNVDAKQALTGLAGATNTFLFPVSSNTIFVARDLPQKREEYEPQVAVTVPLPDVTDPKETTEAENAVRQAFNLRHMGIDTATNTIVIRDRISNANAARSLLETLIRKPAQLAIEAQIFEVDDQTMLTYGTSLPNTVPLLNFGGLKNVTSSIPSGFINFLTFGGGRTLFGFGVTNASAFGTYSKSHAQSIFDATVVVSSGGTALWHVGDKFPIPSTLSSGSAVLGNPLATYVANIQMVDLGLLLKVQPQLHGDGDISMNLHAEYQALGSQTLNTVPTILQRQFEGNVRLSQGEWAILAGLDTQSTSVAKSGIAGLGEIPGIGELFSQINKTQANSHTLLVLKPHVLTEPPLADPKVVYVGGEYGRKVLL